MRDAIVARSPLSARLAVVAVLATVLLAGCTTAVGGRPAPAPGAAPPTAGTSAPPVDVIPAPELSVGTLLEAHRIAGVTALVQTTFPERTENCFPSGAFLSAPELEAPYFAAGSVAGILDSYGFVTAWGQCNQGADGRGTLTLVMELSDPDSAARAADELTAAQMGDRYAAAELPGLGAPALLAADAGVDTVQVFVPVGRMVAYAFHETGGGQGLAEVDRLMRDQTTLLASFVPTPQAEVAALPVDPHGLQQLTLSPPGELNAFSGPYDLESYLRLAIDPVRERELLLANGFTGMYSKQSANGALTYAVALYAFPTSVQTNAVFNAFAELERSTFGGMPFRLPSIPAAPCFAFVVAADGTAYQRCYVGFGSYLASVDVGGLSSPDDIAEMDRLLPAQRDLIDG